MKRDYIWLVMIALSILVGFSVTTIALSVITSFTLKTCFMLSAVVYAGMPIYAMYIIARDIYNYYFG